MIFGRLFRKSPIQIRREEDHAHDLVYQYHINPQFLFYIDECEKDEELVLIRGESVRGCASAGDRVLLLDCKGNTLLEEAIVSIAVGISGVERTNAGDQNVAIWMKDIGAEHYFTAQMLAIKGENQ